MNALTVKSVEALKRRLAAKGLEEATGKMLASEAETIRAGHFLEFGAHQMRARPFLWPVFSPRLPRIKQDLTNTLRACLAK